MGMDANGELLERAVDMFVLDPILKIVNAVATPSQNVLDAVLDKTGLQLSDQGRGLEGNELLNAIMRNFLPADELRRSALGDDHHPSSVCPSFPVVPSRDSL